MTVVCVCCCLFLTLFLVQFASQRSKDLPKMDQISAQIQEIKQLCVSLPNV